MIQRNFTAVLKRFRSTWFVLKSIISFLTNSLMCKLGLHVHFLRVTEVINFIMHEKGEIYTCEHFISPRTCFI